MLPLVGQAVGPVDARLRARKAGVFVGRAAVATKKAIAIDPRRNPPHELLSDVRPRLGHAEVATSGVVEALNEIGGVGDVGARVSTQREQLHSQHVRKKFLLLFV